jgi:prevent-host-death family protein
MLGPTSCVRHDLALDLQSSRVMLTVGLTEAKRRFEELVELAVQGERIRITRYGKPKADMVGAQTNRRKPRVSKKAGKDSRK